MLHTQLPPCIVSGVPWSHGRTLDHGCQFCAASGLSMPPSRSLSVTAFLEDSRPTSKRVLRVWYQFEPRLHRQGQGVRLRESQLKSRPSNSVLLATKEGTAQPVNIEISSANSSQNVPRRSYLEASPLEQFSASIERPSILPRTLRLAQLSVVDQAFVLLGLMACTTSFALFALIVTAIPTLNAMRRAALSVEKLADIAREELPGTMAAIRLSGMEISDLTLELNDLSQQISDRVRNSARAVQSAEVGIREIGAVAASQTFAMLQETANVPVQVVRPAVASAAATTLHAVSQAQKLVISLASSSYPRISGWLGQRGRPGKREKPVGEVSLSTATLTELLTGEETPASSFLSGGSQLSLFENDDGDEQKEIRMPSASEN